METPAPDSLLPIIQLSITPVILMSGIGSLLITLTNRMARVVDRTRGFTTQILTAHGEERDHLSSQLDILWRRAKLVRRAVTYAATSMLMACLLVMVIFADGLLHFHLGAAMVGVFIASVALVIVALVAFLQDIFVSLAALKLDVERARRISR
jgi:hypothetical protein